MTMAQPRDQYSSPPRPLFTSDGGDRPNMQLPSLPSMSSLLAGASPQRHPMEVEQRQFGYTQRPFPSHLNHPLQFSETNPTAPLHHLYHPPQPNRASYQPQPVLVPAHNNLSPMQYEPPVAQQRQSKTISQRRDIFSKENEQVNRYPAHMENRVEELSPPHPRPYEQDRAHYSPQSLVSPSQTSPLDMAPSKSIPISNLLSGNLRYDLHELDRTGELRLTLTAAANQLSTHLHGMGSSSVNNLNQLVPVGLEKEIEEW